MSFDAPLQFLWLLALPVVIGGYSWHRRSRTRRLGSLLALGLAVKGDGRSDRFRKHLPFALFVLALALLVTAWAKPVASITTLERQATVVVVLDVSNSMAAADVKPSRFAVAKAAAITFIRTQPSACASASSPSDRAR